MVCSRGESLTHRINQMKLLNAIAAAAVIGASFIIANPVEARNGWIEAVCGTNPRNERGCHYYRVLSRNSPFVIVDEKSTFPVRGKKEIASHREIDCNGWKSRTRWQWADTGWDSWDPWEDIFPGTIGDGRARKVC